MYINIYKMVHLDLTNGNHQKDLIESDIYD